MRKIPVIISILIFFAGPSKGDEYREKINNGYDYYRNGEYDKAIDHFGKAGVLRPDKPLPNFDKGGALYRSDDFEGAAKEYSLAIEKGDKKYLSDFYYNLGNSLYKSEKYEEAVKSYIKALQIKPDDVDYKQNLELSLIRKQQQEKQQQNQQQDQKQNKDKNKDNKDQDNKEEKKKDQDRNENDKKENQDDSQQQASNDEKDKQKQRQPNSDNKQEMTEEEAKNLLSRFEEDEKEIQRKLKQVRLRGKSRYDW